VRVFGVLKKIVRSEACWLMPDAALRSWLCVSICWHVARNANDALWHLPYFCSCAVYW